MCVLFVILLVAVSMLFTGPIVTAALRQGLERANGATVDIDTANMDFDSGRLTVNGLAICDPNALDTNLLAAAKLEADISNTDLLRKRITLDRVVLIDAVHGAKRVVPGRIVGPLPRPSDAGETKEGEKTLGDYLENAERWKQRLAQAKRWLDPKQARIFGARCESAAGGGGSVEVLATDGGRVRAAEL